MGSVTSLPQSRPLTRDDLALLPEDGHRYELVDGTLLVTPAPGVPHQDAVLALAVLLREHCPPELKVIVAPFAVALAPDTEVQPDVLVASRSALTERDLPGPPVLAVEVLSPSTRSIDLHLKRRVYEAAGCPSYWVVDPAVPSLTVWQLRHDQYVEVAHISGDERVTVTEPFEVTLRASALLD